MQILWGELADEHSARRGFGRSARREEDWHAAGCMIREAMLCLLSPSWALRDRQREEIEAGKKGKTNCAVTTTLVWTPPPRRTARPDASIACPSLSTWTAPFGSLSSASVCRAGPDSHPDLPWLLRPSLVIPRGSQRRQLALSLSSAGTDFSSSSDYPRRGVRGAWEERRRMRRGLSSRRRRCGGRRRYLCDLGPTG